MTLIRKPIRNSRSAWMGACELQRGNFDFNPAVQAACFVRQWGVLGVKFSERRNLFSSRRDSRNPINAAIEPAMRPRVTESRSQIGAMVVVL
jgi:hypothetical protein